MFNPPYYDTASASLQVQSGKTGSVKWNFTKFLVDKSGTKVERFGTKTAPQKLIPNIEQLLAQ